MKYGPTIQLGDGRLRPAERRECEYCGRPFMAAIAEIKRGHGRYCSLTCARYDVPRKRVVKPCEWCGVDISREPNQAKRIKTRFCSNRCAAFWKHANTDIRNKSMAHYAARKVYKLTHDKIECIVPWCHNTKIHIHHRNHNPSDNRPKNLIAICDKHHNFYHKKLAWFIKRKGYAK